MRAVIGASSPANGPSAACEKIARGRTFSAPNSITALVKRVSVVMRRLAGARPSAPSRRASAAKASERPRRASSKFASSAVQRPPPSSMMVRLALRTLTSRKPPPGPTGRKASSILSSTRATRCSSVSLPVGGAMMMSAGVPSGPKAICSAPLILRWKVMSPPSNCARCSEIRPISSGSTFSSRRTRWISESTPPRPSSIVTPIARSSSALRSLQAISTPSMPTGRPPRAAESSVWTVSRMALSSIGPCESRHQATATPITRAATSPSKISTAMRVERRIIRATPAPQDKL